MLNSSEATIESKKVIVYLCGEAGAPTVYSPMYTEAGTALLEECAESMCPPFNLVTISGLRWDEELTPWKYEPVISKEDHFEGKADEYTIFMTDKVIPFAGKVIGSDGPRVLAGYSLAGLYALYAPYRTDAFQRLVSASGSLWYPDFLEFAMSHGFRRKPESVYLSLGDRESRSKNAYVSRNQGNTEQLMNFYVSQGIKSVFELNPGNHFNNATGRLAKGIIWTMSHFR